MSNLSFSYDGRPDSTLRKWSAQLVRVASMVNVLDVNYDEEVLLPYLFDGDKVYRKMLKLDAGPNNSTINLYHGIQEPMYWVRYYGSIQNAAGTGIPLPQVDSSPGTNHIELQPRRDFIRIISTADWSTWSGHIILEYTKVARNG